MRALADYHRTVELGLGVCFRESAPTALVAERKGQTGAGAMGAIVFGSDQGLVVQFNDVVADYAINTLAVLPGKPSFTFLFAGWWAGRSATKERLFMMNHTDGWMSGWIDGGMWILTMIGVLVVVLLVVAISKLSTK